ncbi:MAG: hydantoinase [Planctomycetaceae bacterium]|nr:hydantoinase [Planctomycetaceae bacterium]
MSESPWQFWIDVGGTFTDCFARCPDGQLTCRKVLSSGITRGRAGEGSTATCIVDARRAEDPSGVWAGYQIRFFDRQGNALVEGTVADSTSDSGQLQLDPPLSLDLLPAGCRYELSSDEEAPLVAIRYLLGLGRQGVIPRVMVRLGTTRGTNALLTRNGARCAFVTTRGFADVLLIGYQERARLFDLDVSKSAPLFSAVAEIDERIASDGQELQVPVEEEVRRQLATLKSGGIESLAICLLNAYTNASHEKLVERIAREEGFVEISRSSEVAPLVKVVSRGDTTVVDAYLNPVLRTYLSGLRRSLGDDASLHLLTSAGGLVAAESFVGKDSLLSGPAGGVVGFSRVALAAGFKQAIGFDMGGTSTDVSRFEDHYEMEYETEKAGVRVVAPMMAIETVAAGGGSICSFDGTRLTVGPASAGADPGPACYGRGGPLAVTDMNLLLGRILEDQFPFPLDLETVRQQLDTLCQEILQATGVAYDPVQLATGFLRVANHNMAQAIRSISVARGYDPRQDVMVTFGGAAPQHACAVARELGIETILVHPHASILSALGIGLADITRHRVAGVYRAYSEAEVERLVSQCDQLEEQVIQEVLKENVAIGDIEVQRLVDLRHVGLEMCLTIPWSESVTLAAAYADEHRRLYGYHKENRPLEIVAVRVVATGRSSIPVEPSVSVTPSAPPAAETMPLIVEGKQVSAAVYWRADLQPGMQLEGPAMVVDSMSTTVIDPGWRAEIYSGGELVLRDQGSSPVAMIQSAADPVLLEVFNNHFSAIAEQMGITLQNTCCSVNVKERFDFSCAIFTAAGDLVVNAPHIPVHLGAMSETVRCVVLDNPEMAPGDVFITNDPYRGGSHLPDLTVVTPVYDAEGSQRLFFTASRAHHAEIGGITPGSMPPFSRNLAEEGVVIRNFKMVDRGQPRMEELAALLSAGPYPTRSLAENIADIEAQVAANHQGATDLLKLVERYDLEIVTAYMKHIQVAADQKMRAALDRLEDGQYRFHDFLDNGARIQVQLDIHGDQVTIDFSGTDPVLPGNLNANRAIVTAAVMYVMRCLINEEIPLNQGVLSAITLQLPDCLLNPSQGPDDERTAAVVGGNVETSQRVVDVLLGALGLAAASQGTMNNVVFGNESFGYYETICGGAGATARTVGADAIHTHMTNTRLTDPEIMEQRFPVRVTEFSIRRGSGGDGRNPGGDGVYRQLEFLAPLEVSILSNRREQWPPYGLHGGEPGACGRNTLLRSGEEPRQLPGQVQLAVEPGDQLVIETPGGGGYGDSAD